MDAQKPFTVLLADDAKRGAGHAFDEAAKLVERIPHALLHVAYLFTHGTRLEDLERVAPSLRSAARVRATSRGVNDRFAAVYLRAGDPVRAISMLVDELAADLVVTSAPARRGIVNREMVDRLRAELLCPLLTVSPIAEPVPEVEPVCPQCALVRAQTKGKTFWCDLHARHHIRAHGWSYRNDIPFSTHDSEVIPTGIAFPD